MHREPRITPTGPEDLAAVVALHGRCSAHALWSRYHRAMADPRDYLPVLLKRPGSVHLAAQDAGGRIVAVGHLVPDGSAAEVALLVEDVWQDNGLGTRLLHRLGCQAAQGDWTTVYGLALAGDGRIASILRRSPVTVHQRNEAGVITAWARTRDLAAGLPVLDRRSARWNVGRRASSVLRSMSRA
ncbi:GNAT family N-acetyltransferase [Streptomyces sp. CB02400]|uniref:GNAT family N-acetyltransferase n=1 Tax=Streptomyces sp. CB02400 TaxID=1703944 RepID=UPI0009392100|nr:GNAT family N-acetyltransferase [Streptomyces sp. CB02400]